MEVLDIKEIVKGFETTEQISGDECRICLKKCIETCQLFRNDNGIPQKLMAVAAVQIEEGDGLPTTICLPCNQLLDVSYDFKCQIQKSDVLLREILKVKSSTQRNMKNESIVEAIIADVISNVVSHKTVTNDNKDNTSKSTVKDENDCIAVHSVIQNDVQNFINDTNTSVLKFKEDSIQSNKETIHTTSNNSMTINDIVEDKTDSEKCEAHIVDNILIDHINSSPIIVSEKRCIKQEDVTELTELSENEDNATNQDLIQKEEIFKIEIKNDMSLEDIGNDTLSEETSKEIDVNPEVEMITNCSDDEEKPLISRTSRQKCPNCIKSFATKLALQRHMIVHKHKTKLRYVCYICDKQFSNIAKLKNHVFNSHDTHKNDKKENIQDKEIDINIEGTGKNCSNLIDNTKREKKNFKFTCKVCSKQFTYQKSFLTHAKNHPEYKSEILSNSNQTLNKSYEVKGKSSSFKENESDEEEEDDDDDSDLPVESLQCTQCGKLFATKRNLKRHISTHSGLKFNCETCGKGFSRIDKLKDHEQSKHKEEIFGNSDEEEDDDTENENKINEPTENRKKERHNRPHKCAMCPKAFAQPQSLANHIERHKRVKDTQKRFLCEVCSKCFAQSGSLVAHMRTHTGVKPYVCNVCSRAFTKSTYLQLHLRTHSGEKPYICQYCSRAFARANTLARHITMHTGEAKYHCQICTKSFRRLTSLNEHTYTHTGQRPYACKICTKRYNNAGSLYAHTKKCKAQQLSGSAATFTVSVENSTQQSGSVSQVLIYSQRKLVEDATVGQVTPTPQYMIANVHNQKTLPTNLIQPFPVDDQNVYTVNSKQFKNPYYAIYPNM